MARLSQDKIEQIRQSVDIVDVLGQYLSLEKKGRNYVAICPFHD
ncbi:MAG: CHC2 zinc finger domain-containing protein, partial [Coprobacillus sp.]